MKGKAARLASGGWHHEDIEVTVAFGREGELLAILAPGRHIVVSVVKGELSSRSAGSRHLVQVAFIGKGDLATVGRDGGVAQPVGGSLGG